MKKHEKRGRVAHGYSLYIDGEEKIQVIFHSDRGSQYASEAYRKFCRKKNVLPSMSRRCNCYDNSYVESWFSSLKKEKIYRRNYRDEADLRASVFDYIERWYNRKRKHSALGYMSPMQYKQSYSVHFFWGIPTTDSTNDTRDS